MQTLITFICTAILIYLGFSFGEATFNISLWEPYMRFVCVIMMGFLSAVVAAGFF